MSTLITRVYEAYGDALNAVNELKKNRFTDQSVRLFSMAPNDAEGGQALVDRIVQAGVPAADAQAFASLLEQGHSLVTVRAVMGVGQKATAIVNAHHPMADPLGPRTITSPQSTRARRSLRSSGFPLSRVIPLPSAPSGTCLRW